jgi:hypothetical protein
MPRDPRASDGAMAAGAAAGRAPGAAAPHQLNPPGTAAEAIQPRTELLYRIKKRKTKRAVSKSIVENWFERLTGARATLLARVTPLGQGGRPQGLPCLPAPRPGHRL